MKKGPRNKGQGYVAFVNSHYGFRYHLLFIYLLPTSFEKKVSFKL